MNVVVPPQPRPLRWGVAASYWLFAVGLLVMLLSPTIWPVLVSTIIRSMGAQSCCAEPQRTQTRSAACQHALAFSRLLLRYLWVHRLFGFARGLAALRSCGPAPGPGAPGGALPPRPLRCFPA